MSTHQSPRTLYRGRLAPSPTGYLHLGHARTFWVAQERARANNGVLVLRNEDMDAMRFKLEFAESMIEDLKWFGFDWQEGPDVGGPFAPYNRRERLHIYRDALNKFVEGGFVYSCGYCSSNSVLARRGRSRRRSSQRQTASEATEGLVIESGVVVKKSPIGRISKFVVLVAAHTAKSSPN